jgi:hypothetical protein
VPLANFFLDRLDPGADASVPERVRAAEKIGRTIARVEDPVTFSLLAKQAAQRLGVDESVFRDLRKRSASNEREGSNRVLQDDDAPAETWRPEEVALIEVMALNRTVADTVAASGVLDKLESRTLADAGTIIAEVWAKDGKCDAVLDRLPRPIAERVAGSLLGEGPSAAANHDQIARDCMRRVELRAHRAEARANLTRLREIESAGDDRELRKELERSIVLLRQREVQRD